MTARSEAVIGYSAFDPFEECYEYCENACYIADSQKSLTRSLAASFSGQADLHVVPVRLADLENDFGTSSGPYAMEREALQRFRLLAEQRGLRYDVRPYAELSFDHEDVSLFLATLHS